MGASGWSKKTRSHLELSLPLPTSSLMPSYHKHESKTTLVLVLMAYTVPREVLREWSGRDHPATPSPVSHLGPDPAQESGQLSFTSLGVSVAALAALDTQSAEA